MMFSTNLYAAYKFHATFNFVRLFPTNSRDMRDWGWGGGGGAFSVVTCALQELDLWPGGSARHFAQDT